MRVFIRKVDARLQSTSLSGMRWQKVADNCPATATWHGADAVTTPLSQQLFSIEAASHSQPGSGRGLSYLNNGFDAMASSLPQEHCQNVWQC